MGSKSINLDAEAEESDDPLAFLKSIMEGNDPRKSSELYNMIMEEYEDNFGEPPCAERWEEIVEFIEENCRNEKVPVALSRQAAQTLMEYRHAKKKQGSGKNLAETTAELPPLTEPELELFMDWFDANF